MTQNTLIRTDASSIPRGRGSKPKIIPPGGGDHVLYHRPSTIAKALDDTGNLLAWYGRQAIKGVVNIPEYYDSAKADPSDANLKIIQPQAHKAAGSEDAADTGTLVHTLTERVDQGAEPSGEHADLLFRYRDLTADLEVLESELFVVQDELQAAGSMDRLVRTPDGRVYVADVKTGAHAATYGANSAATQVAIYANSRRYDPNTGERQELHPNIDLTRGILIHLPLTGEPALYWLDLVNGWNAAVLAGRVRACRATKMIYPY